MSCRQNSLAVGQAGAGCGVTSSELAYHAGILAYRELQYKAADALAKLMNWSLPQQRQMLDARKRRLSGGDSYRSERTIAERATAARIRRLAGE